MKEIEKIKDCFCRFIEGSLILHNIDEVLKLFTEDVMGIGMGAQGTVSCKEDLRSILSNSHSEGEDTETTIQYENMQIRYYGNEYASICSKITIQVKSKERIQKSHIGQCASMRNIDGEWKINMVQATPLSVDIQEIDAYPIAYAEDEIEKYRMQEQFTRIMQKNMIALYKIDFTLGKYEDYCPYGGYSVPVNKGDSYEKKLFKAANHMLSGEARRNFIQTFSIANLKSRYDLGQLDINLDYESLQPDGTHLWQRSSMHLFTDTNGHLKGYLYLLDINAQKLQEIRLTQQAELDLMTSVYNKETSRKKIELAIELYSMPSTCAFFMIDLDFFKSINDTYGHAEGDIVIQETAAALKANFRKQDIIGRLGGDEFCVFYTGENTPVLLEKLAVRICNAVRKIRPAKPDLPGTSISIGIARRVGNEDFDTLYKKADEALYVSKSIKGRDTYTFYEELEVL